MPHYRLALFHSCWSSFIHRYTNQKDWLWHIFIEFHLMNFIQLTWKLYLKIFCFLQNLSLILQNLMNFQLRFDHLFSTIVSQKPREMKNYYLCSFSNHHTQKLTRGKDLLSPNVFFTEEIVIQETFSRLTHHWSLLKAILR